MKPEKFKYFSPSTIKEAINLLKEYGFEANLLAGGQSLIPILNMRLATPDYLIDLRKLKELEYIKLEEDYILIGAQTKQSAVEHSTLIKKACPILAEAIKFVGNFQIRNRGTVGGSIAHADPSAELPCVLSALRGEIVVISQEGERRIRPDEFFLSYLFTTLEPTELIKEIRFPAIPKTSGYSFVQKARRYGDFSLAGALSVLDLDEEGNISYIRLAICGVHPTPLALEKVESFLLGKKPNDQLFAEAADKVPEIVNPEDDLHGSADYRRHLASVLTRRSLKAALAKTAGGTHNG